MEIFQKDTELEKLRRQEEGVFLQKINRFAVPFVILLIMGLSIWGEVINFPTLQDEMVPAKLFGLSLMVICTIAAFIPKLESKGYIFGSLFFAALSLMMANLTALSNNEFSSSLLWLVSIIFFCGIYPLRTFHSLVVFILSVLIYVVTYHNTGFSILDLKYQITLATIVGTGAVSLIAKLGILRIAKREFYFRKGLETANVQLADLKEKFRDENLRSSYQLELVHRVMGMVAPKKRDYADINELDIAGLMIPLHEVGGDYFDVIKMKNGAVITIGDATEYGLPSTLVMVTAHSAIRALSYIPNSDIVHTYEIVNKLLYDFRIKHNDKFFMSLAILEYGKGGKVRLTGCHEPLIVIRKNKSVEKIEVRDLSIYAGLENDISSAIKTREFNLDIGDVLILYTDGVSEAKNADGFAFGIDGIIQSALPVSDTDSDTIKSAILNQCLAHLDHEEFQDDLSVLVVKRKKAK